MSTNGETADLMVREGTVKVDVPVLDIPNG